MTEAPTAHRSAGRKRRRLTARARFAVAGAASVAVLLSLASTASAQQTGGVKLTTATRAAAPADDQAPTWLGRGPSAAADDQSGMIYVFWTGPQGTLHEANSTGNGTWNSFELSAFGTLYSQPSVVVSNLQHYGSDSWVYVFWQGGGDHKLWMAYWGKNGGWSSSAVSIPSAGSIGSQPTASQVFLNGQWQTAVYWAGATNNNLWYIDSPTPYDPNSWSAATEATHNGNPIGPIQSGAPTASGVCVGSSGCQSDYIYWQGSDDALSEATRDVPDGTFDAQFQPYNGILGSEPNAVIEPSSGDNSVVWRGSGGTGDLWLLDGGTKGASPVNLGMGPLGSAPAIAEREPAGANSGEQWFFWKGGTNDDLWEAHTSTDGMKGPYDLNIGPIGTQP